MLRSGERADSAGTSRPEHAPKPARAPTPEPEPAPEPEPEPAQPEPAQPERAPEPALEPAPAPGPEPARPDTTPDWMDLDEMEEPDLLNVLTYFYRAVRQAYKEEVSPEVLDILMSSYDQVFVTLAANSDRFKEAVRSGKHQPVLGTTKEQVYKYKSLAGV